jgi:hypothetical protein
MRPALTEQALVRRRDAIDLTGKRILLTGASSGIGDQPRHRNRVGRKGCALDDAVLPPRQDADDRTDARVPRAARVERIRSRRLDDHGGEDPAGANRPRMAVTAHALNSVAPSAVDAIMKRQRVQPSA